ncbi:MAG TPA: hypothetical protein VKM55_24825 [Candidatus Lokiarchaeia archaeon]|nr:hypothetical protein [Candidatus Lokiarchaeia archaeon]
MHLPDFPSDKGDPTTTTGGILPGIVHVLAGPTWLLAELLMHLAISSQLPMEHGGIGCERVIYGLFDNATNPNDMASEARALGMNPADVIFPTDFSEVHNGEINANRTLFLRMSNPVLSWYTIKPFPKILFISSIV